MLQKAKTYYVAYHKTALPVILFLLIVCAAYAI